jgi:hypothetical protein
MSEVGRKAANIKKLHEIANLVPDPGIIVDIFEDLYPGAFCAILLESR